MYTTVETRASGSNSWPTLAMLRIAKCVMILASLFPSGQAAPCTSSDYLGTNSVTSLGQSVGSSSGRQFLMTDSEYINGCCGYVRNWVIYAGDTGNIIFQVWRPNGSSYSLVGENTGTVSALGMYTLSVGSSDQIDVQTNDVIGWYTSGDDIVMYKFGGSRNNNNYVETMAQPSVGDTVTFSNRWTNRDFAVRAELGSSSPSFTNLAASISVPKASVSTSSSVFTATATHPDLADSLTYSVQSSTPSGDFTVDSASGEVTPSTSSVTPTTYTVVIRATDGCGNTVDGTLTIDVVNQSPVIYSLPDVVQLSESAVDEMLLHTVNVTDPDGDVVTCSMTSSPAGPFLTRFVSSGAGGALANGLYVQANPNFDYSTTNAYELTVTCSDAFSASDSGILYVFITKNSVPVITNLQNTTNIYSYLPISSMVFSVLASDPEGDQTYFNLTCTLPTSPCPFNAYSDGSIILTTSLIGTTTSAYEVDVSVADDFSSSGLHRLTIFVLDLNVAPVLTNLPASIQVTEDKSVGSVVFDTSIHDDNGDTSFTFSAIFSPASGAALFSINATTGQVTVAGILNYLTQVNSYNLTITVTDGRDPSVSQALQIDTIDVNQAPVLYQTNYMVEATEGSAGTVFPDPSYNVYEPDSDTLTYSFITTGSDETAGFTINSTDGTISYSISYDVDNPLTNVTRYVWLIGVSDPDGLSATATLTVSILDINDNVPSFNSNSYSGTVSSEASLGTVVLTAVSTDKDITSEYQEVAYSIYNTNNFRIDHGGNIVVYQSLANLGGTEEACYIRVQNPGINTYDTAFVSIRIYVPNNGAFFDDPANIAWVTLTCILGAALLAGLAVLACRLWPGAGSAVKPPLQVAPYETRMPTSRPVSQRTVSVAPATPSDIRVIDKQWQAWHTGAPLWEP